MPTYNNADYINLMRPLPHYVKRDLFDIPYIEIDDIDITGLNNTKWLINMKNAKATDINANKKIVHSFCYDDVLLRAYNNPIKYLHRVSGYYAVATFDFSMHDDMDFRHILAATYDNRWIGAFMQSPIAISYLLNCRFSFFHMFPFLLLPPSQNRPCGLQKENKFFSTYLNRVH